MLQYIPPLVIAWPSWNTWLLESFVRSWLLRPPDGSCNPSLNSLWAVLSVTIWTLPGFGPLPLAALKILCGCLNTSKQPQLGWQCEPTCWSPALQPSACSETCFASPGKPLILDLNFCQLNHSFGCTFQGCLGHLAKGCKADQWYYKGCILISQLICRGRIGRRSMNMAVSQDFAGFSSWLCHGFALGPWRSPSSSLLESLSERRARAFCRKTVGIP